MARGRPHGGAPVDDFSREDSDANACGPACHGECFAGRCLFVASDLDLALPPRATDATTAPHAPASPADLLVTFAPAPAEALFATAPSEKRAQLSLATASKHAVGSGGRAPWEDAPVALPRRPAGDEPPATVLRATPPSVALAPRRETATLLAVKAPASQGEREAAWLPRFPRVAVDAALGAENAALRNELDRWRQAGAQVAKREAGVVAMLKRVAQKRVGGDAASLLDQSLARADLAAAKQIWFPWIPLLLTLIAMPALAIGACAFSPSGVDGVSKDAHRGVVMRTREFVGQTLRKCGVGGYVVEISELQVGSLKVIGDVRVVVNIGGRELRSKTAEVPGVAVLRFGDVFAVPVHKFDCSKCSLSIVDWDTEEILARRDMSAQEFLHLIHREHGEYFNFDLSPLAKRLSGGKAPNVAMRLRDGGSSATAAASKSGSGSGLARGGAAAGAPARWPPFSA